MKTKGIIMALLFAASASISATGLPQSDGSAINEDENTSLIADSSQYHKQNRVSIYGTVGYGSLLYGNENDHSKGFVGGGGGVDYVYFISKRWGIGAGLNFVHYQSTFSQENYTTYEMVDNDINNLGYTLHQNVKTKERQMLGNFGIPIKAHFRTWPFNNKRWELNAAAGFMLGIPVYEGAKVIDGSIERKAYFSDGHILVDGNGGSQSDQNIAKHEGLGTFNEFVNYNGKNNFGIEVASVLQVGFAYRYNDLVSFDMAAYATYGLNNIKSQELSPASSGTYSGVTTTTMVGGIHSLFAGLKLGVNFDMAGCKGKQRASAKARRAKRYAEEMPQPKVNVENELDEESKTMLEESLKLLKEMKENQDSKADDGFMPGEDENGAIRLSDGRYMYLIWNFPLGTANINASIENQLEKFIAKNNIKDAKSIVVVGRADESGTKAINDKISAKRAESVKQWLVNNANIDANKIKTDSKGSATPIANTNDLNRSVLIIF